MTLSDAELQRYDRQIGPGVLSVDQQQRLRESTALVTRVGGMGGPAAQMLVMGGVGRVIIAHGGDLVSPDLNRQVLGSEAGLGQPRATQFAQHLRSLNRFVEVEAISHEPSDAESAELARRCDVLLACPPTFEERLRLNEAAVGAGKPLIDAAQWGMTGTLSVFQPGETACLRCIYPQQPTFEKEFPVVGAISAAMGALAALEAIKILAGCGQPLWGQTLLYDGYRGTSRQVKLRKLPNCPVCGQTGTNGRPHQVSS